MSLTTTRVDVRNIHPACTPVWDSGVTVIFEPNPSRAPSFLRLFFGCSTESSIRSDPRQSVNLDIIDYNPTASIVRQRIDREPATEMDNIVTRLSSLPTPA